MASIEVAIILILTFGIAIAAIASIRIFKEEETFVREFGQLAFVWLVPVIGPLVTMQLLRKELERGSGVYASDSSPLEDGERLNLRDATFETKSTKNERSGHGENSDASHE